MPFKRYFSVLFVAACVLALGGCVVAPLAQMAATQMLPTKPACTACAPDMTTGLFGDVSKGVTDSFHKVTASASANQQTASQQTASQTPAK